MNSGEWGKPPAPPAPQRPPVFEPPRGAPNGSPGGWPGAPPPPMASQMAPRAQPTRGLGTAAIVLMWCTTGGLFLLALASRHRWSVVDDYTGGGGSWRDVRDADNLVAGAFAPVLLLAIAIAIVLAIWSQRVTSNAAQAGVDVQPGLAAGSWFIPVAWFILPFMLLNRARRDRGSATPLVWWAICFGVTGVSMVAQRGAVGDVERTIERGEVIDALQQQTWIIVFAAFVAIGATIAAMQAIRQLDAITSAAS